MRLALRLVASFWDIYVVSSEMSSLPIRRPVGLRISSGEGETRKEGWVNMVLLLLPPLRLLLPATLLIKLPPLFFDGAEFWCPEGLFPAVELEEECERDWEALSVRKKQEEQEIEGDRGRRQLSSQEEWYGVGKRKSCM